MKTNRAVITVIGKDSVGILARVATLCAKYSTNVIDVTQTVMQDLFAMIMLTDISNMTSEFTTLVDEMKKLGEETNLSIHVMHEDIFNAMHKI